MPALWYLQILAMWKGTPDEKYAQWDKTYNYVEPPPSQSFATDWELALYLEAHCNYPW